MHINTTRFGAIRIEPDDIFLLPQGLIGFEECRRWVLLADAQNPAVGWLQSATHPDVALAVVSPRRFVPNYRVRVSVSELAPLELEAADRAFVLAVVAKHEENLTINLKAPLILNLDRRLGRQVITSDDQPLVYTLPHSSAELRKAA